MWSIIDHADITPCLWVIVLAKQLISAELRPELCRYRADITPCLWVIVLAKQLYSERNSIFRYVHVHIWALSSGGW